MTLAPYQRPGLALADEMQLPAAQQLAASALRDRLTAQSAAALGRYVPWARQSGSAWLTISPVDHEVDLYTLTDADVAAANAASHGDEVPWVAVRTPQPVPPALALAAWDDTRYDLLAVEGVYRADDPSTAPRIEFLYWAQLHDGFGGGRGSLSVAAARLGGDLVWPCHVHPAPGRPEPALPFTVVLAAQQAQRSAPAAAGLGVTIAPADPAPASAGIAGPLVLATACATAAYLVWGSIRPTHRANRRRR